MYQNENKAIQTSNQTTVEEHGDKKHLLMLLYQGGKYNKKKQTINSVRKL